MIDPITFHIVSWSIAFIIIFIYAMYVAYEGFTLAHKGVKDETTK